MSVRVTWGVIVLIPILAALATGVLFLVQAQHQATLAYEAEAIRTLEAIHDATVVLDRQREILAASVYDPFDREAFAARTAEFQRLLTDPALTIDADDRPVLRQILARQRSFSRATLALPTLPTPAQAQPVRAHGDDASRLLDTLRRGYVVDIDALLETEARQRRFSTLVLLLTNLLIIVLVVGGFVLLNRLGQWRAEAQTLRATDKLRAEFVAFAAHELRNPISAIKTGVALLQDETLDVATRRQVVNSIDRSAAALMRLVLNFLNLGRVEAGELRLQRRAVALAELGDTLLEELRQYHTGIETRVACDLPAIPVDIDLEYIKLVLANLIDNAVKFSPAHAPIEISGEALNGMAVVHVRDHGSGIPRDRLPLIFSRYETAGGEARGGQRGFGLGLYMARLLVESHGGAIWAESEEGQGTTISFSLPRAG